MYSSNISQDKNQRSSDNTILEVYESQVNKINKTLEMVPKLIKDEGKNNRKRKKDIPDSTSNKVYPNHC